MFTPVAPFALNKPAYGTGMPPNESHGEPVLERLQLQSSPNRS